MTETASYGSHVDCFLLEMARCYGSEATSSALKNIYVRYIRPDVKAIHSQLAAGGDPKDVVLSWEKPKGGSGT